MGMETTAVFHRFGIHDLGYHLLIWSQWNDTNQNIQDYTDPMYTDLINKYTVYQTDTASNILDTAGDTSVID